MATVAQACLDILRQITQQQPDAEHISSVQLSGTHQNYCYHWGDQKFLVKILRPHAGEIFSWDSHWRLQSLLAVHGIAPNVYHFDQNIWVEQWIYHAYCSADDILETAYAMARMHHIPLLGRDASCAKWYPKLSENLPEYWQNDRVFGHNDLQTTHIIEQKVVDWEYAGMTERAYDIANCVVINGWSSAQQNAFLSHYCALISPLNYELASAVNAYIPIVREINSQWVSKFSNPTI